MFSSPFLQGIPFNFFIQGSDRYEFCCTSNYSGRLILDLIEFFVKIQKYFFSGGGGRVGWGGVGLVGIRVDVNAMLGVGGGVVYGGCEPKMEGIVKCT